MYKFLSIAGDILIGISIALCCCIEFPKTTGFEIIVPTYLTLLAMLGLGIVIKRWIGEYQ